MSPDSPGLTQRPSDAATALPPVTIPILDFGRMMLMLPLKSQGEVQQLWDTYWDVQGRDYGLDLDQFGYCPSFDKSVPYIVEIGDKRALRYNHAGTEAKDCVRWDMQVTRDSASGGYHIQILHTSVEELRGENPVETPLQIFCLGLRRGDYHFPGVYHPANYVHKVTIGKDGLEVDGSSIRPRENFSIEKDPPLMHASGIPYKRGDLELMLLGAVAAEALKRLTSPGNAVEKFRHLTVGREQLHNIAEGMAEGTGLRFSHGMR